MESPLIYLTAGNIISSLGFGLEENVSSIQRGVFRQRQGLIDKDTLQHKIESANIEKGYTRLEQLLLLSIQDVLLKSGIAVQDCGMIISTTKGNIDCINQEGEDAYLSVMGDKIASYFHLPEKPIIISTACISGVSALIVASRLIRSHRYQHILVVGGDLLTRFVETGFQSFKSISSTTCRPYDKERDGLSLGEASGAILMTTDKKWVKESIPVCIEGGAIANDANHISGPSRTGEGLYLAIAKAMEESTIKAKDIGFINAHGTGTIYNDEMESKAIHWAGLDHLPLNSFKPYWGHTLGASGLIESIICLEQLRLGKVFPTPGFVATDVTYPLQVSAKFESLPVKRCLKTASGFGGCNAAILFSTESIVQSVYPVKAISTIIEDSCTIQDNRIFINEKLIFSVNPEEKFSSFIRSAYKQLGINDRKFYKMDDLCRLGYMAAACLLENRKDTFIPEQTGIILSNKSASLDTDRKHQQIIDELGDDEASPAVFVYTLPNVLIGEICIRYGIKGENTFFISEHYDESFIRKYAEIAMERQHMSHCLIGWCDLEANNYQAHFKWLKKNNL